MLGKHQHCAEVPQIRDDIARHVFWYNPKQAYLERDVEMIVQNAFSFEPIRDNLNPSGFAIFCGSVFQRVQDIRRYYQKCEDDVQLGFLEAHSLSKMLTTPTEVELPACAVRAFAKAGYPSQVYGTP